MAKIKIIIEDDSDGESINCDANFSPSISKEKLEKLDDLTPVQRFSLDIMTIIHNRLSIDQKISVNKRKVKGGSKK